MIASNVAFSVGYNKQISIFFLKGCLVCINNYFRCGFINLKKNEYLRNLFGSSLFEITLTWP